MIFSGGLCEKVLDGSKTVTRRPMREDGRCLYKVGGTYAVQPGRGKHSQGRILVTSVTRTVVAAIADADARREGFTDASEFRLRWVQMYGPESYEWECWRIEFELAEVVAA